MLPASITVLDLSAYVGLAAVGAITLNMLLGLLMAFRYSPHRSWPHHRFNYFRFHNWTGYMALAVSILHPVILLFNKDPHFRIRDLDRHLWKAFHFSIYLAAAALFWHSLFNDPGLKNAPVDWPDGGKLFVQSCLFFIAAISLLRLRLARKKALHARQVARQTASATSQ